MTDAGRKRGFEAREAAWPDAALLSNGRYSVMLTAAGSGYSRFGDYALTSWADDATRDADGLFLYIRDLDDEVLWSAGYQPVRRAPDRYSYRRSGGLVEIVREDEGIETRTELCLAPEEPLEIRRYTIHNVGDRRRRLELTTYAEIALDLPGSYAAHPAFSKLFVQTMHRPPGTLLARRRPRSPDDPRLWLAHGFFRLPADDSVAEYETDRARFLGRGRGPDRPVALEAGASLSRAAGSVLDPIASLRRAIALAPGEPAQVVAVLAGGGSEEEVADLAEKYSRAEAVHDALATATRSSAAGSAFQEGQEPDESGAVVGEAARIAALRLEEPRYRPALRVQRAGSTGGRHDDGRHPRAENGDVWTEEPLQAFNGYGGFNAQGDEYVVRLGEGGDLRRPPLPWINVVANEVAGSLVSESGAGYTWCLNSRENRLTPWYNDPVTDPHGEALYLRDEREGLFWSPTPGPVPGPGPYEARHGFGYTHFRHFSRGLEQDTWHYVAREDPIKLIRWRIRNHGRETRKLSAFAYFELVLGGSGRRTGDDAPVTERAHDGRAVLATRPLEGGEFAGRVAFAGVVLEEDARVLVSGDRRTFLGRYGSAAEPAALSASAELDGRTGAGLDPCAALQAILEVAPGESVELAYVVGQGDSRDSALRLLREYADLAAVRSALDDVRTYWRALVSTVRVVTPVPAIDLMLNGWLIYQDLSCRIWGRSALYQSGGAVGFRDQLQDAAALVYARPELTRRQILLHASQQFVEGDVLHWWHPPAGRGLRTRFSDDLLWLPYVTAFYLSATGDASVLDEVTPYRAARPLRPGEDEVYLAPRRADETGSVYEHCCLAIDRSLTRGGHGLPLMGTGDWNDGMNRVGREGRGESVWLGFFLYDILRSWIPLCRDRGDDRRARRYREYASQLVRALNEAGWDGSWYRRAFYDDGTPLGSADSDECRIDAIAQAWSVLSGAAPADRAALALDALEAHLVSEEEGLIRLLTPPFDETPHDPGYIKGYIPGVRENGGQYTHGALWAVRALAEAGRRQRAATLLEMLSPVTRSLTPQAAETYRVEPYVIAADVYGARPHVGRGGWTWYTGSAGWMYRVAIESVLGLELRDGDALAVRPCIPSSWPGYRVSYRLPRGTTYDIEVRNGEGRDETRVVLDGRELALDEGVPVIPLISDGEPHRAVVTLGHEAGRGYAPARIDAR